MAGIGSASDVEVFAAANVEAILASKLKRCFYFHFNFFYPEIAFLSVIRKLQRPAIINEIPAKVIALI